MKTFYIFFSIAICLSLKSQTTVYSVNSDETVDRNSYFYIDHSSGKIIQHDKYSSFRNDYVTSFVLKVKSNTIYIKFKDSCSGKKKFSRINAILGYYTEDKKIVSAKNGALSEKESHYIKENKIYNSENKLVAVIDGSENYGAALFMLNLDFSKF